MTTRDFNVFDYGAVGDGQTNDTQAFQDCLNAATADVEAGSNRARMLIPAGRYRVADVHFVGEGYSWPRLHVVGAGIYNTQIERWQEGDTLFRFSSVNYLGNLSFEGIRFDRCGRALDLHNWTYSQIVNCAFRQCGQVGNHAIHLTGNTLSSALRGCWFYHSAGDDLLLTGGQLRIADTLFGEASGGLHVHGTLELADCAWRGTPRDRNDPAGHEGMGPAAITAFPGSRVKVSGGRTNQVAAGQSFVNVDGAAEVSVRDLRVDVLNGELVRAINTPLGVMSIERPDGFHPPASGLHHRGDRMWHAAPTEGEPVGWICTEAGTPGAWRPFGLVEPGPVAPSEDPIEGAAAAFALRLLRTGYSGACLRARRESDNAEHDVGFDGSGNLHTEALLAFVGPGSSGFVSILYDQTGNGRHWSQASRAFQPRIVNAGSLEVDGLGNPALFSDSDFFDTLAVALPETTGEVFAVVHPDDSEWSILGDGDGAYLPLAASGSSKATVSLGVGDVGFRKNGAVVQPATRGEVHALYNGETSLMGLTGVPLGAITSLLQGGSFSGFRMTGHLSEIILYPDDQADNRAAIEANIATYYGITLA